MASRKEYEMLFALNARMNSGFGGTFSKAQAEFTRLGKEIQSLHRVQGDIASYQKQQSAMDATRSKLDSLRQQHDLLQKEIGETTGSTAALEREKLKLEQRIRDTEAALDRQSQKLEATGARLQEAGVSTADLSRKDAELAARLRELQAEQEKAASGAASFGERSAQAFDAIQQAVVSGGVMDALGELQDAFVACVDGAGNLEEAMSTVEALSQAGARDMAALEAEAKALGAGTRFTALEAADAMSYMGMAGWDAADMLQGMNGVMQLAAASGEDLAQVSDIVTDDLSAFGLTARDTAHFSDVLAAAATGANTNVAIMGETFKQSASVAGALGYSIEDVAVAVGLMANSGVKGSIAGTALKNTFNGLLEGVTLTSEAFGEYEYTAVNANGTMKDFGATIDELRGYFEQMTEAERVNNAMAIAGRHGYNGLLAILNATDKDYASLSQSIQNCTGAAQRMADIKLDNMNGQLTLMNSAWDALKTTIGEQFLPDLRNLYEVGTDAFGLLNDYVRANPGVVKGVAAFVSILGTATAGVTAFAAASKAVQALNLAKVFASAGPALGVTAGIAGVVALYTAWREESDRLAGAAVELEEKTRSLRESMETAGTALEDHVTATMAQASAADRYISRLEELEAAGVRTQAQQDEYHNTLALLCQTVPELSEYIDLQNNTIDGGTGSLRAHTDALMADAKAQAYQEYLASVYKAQADALMAQEEARIQLARAEEEALDIQAAQIDAANRLQALEEKGNREVAARNRRDNGTLSAYDLYGKEMDAVRQEMADLEKQAEQNQYQQDRLNAAMQEGAASEAEAKQAVEDADQAYRNLTGTVEETNAVLEETGLSATEAEAGIRGILDEIEELANAYGEAYEVALGSVQGQYSLWEEADKIIPTNAANINRALESQTSHWQTYNANLALLAERGAEIDGLNELLASFADGSTNSVNAVAGMAKANDDDLKAMVANWKKLREEQQTAADALAELETDFSDHMDAMQANLEETIRDMDLSNEAAAAGRNTIQGFLDAAAELQPAVRSAFAGVAQSALESMGAMPATKHGYVPGLSATGAYASGTDNARRGWAWVGEDGPELMYMHGGERILPARTSAELARQAAQPPVHAGGGAPSVAINLNIQGNATEDTVADLRAASEEIVELVVERLDQREQDRVRSGYL